MTAAPPFHVLELASGAARLTLVPAAGGAIAGWWIGEQAMLCDTPPMAGPDWDPLQMASFPLVPYSNRIGGGTFAWEGVRYRVRLNGSGFEHPLHGVGWLRAWTVEASESDHAVLRYEHRGDPDWPWAFAAEQRFALAEDRLVVALAVINRSDTPSPLAIGMHPYFDAAGAHLQFAAAQIWLAGPDQLPLRAVAPDARADFSAGRPVANTALDNGYDGWDGRAAIWWDDRPLGLGIASDLPCAVVYTPADAGFFCFEPVPHSNNALNLGGAGQPMPVVAPGETFGARVVFDAWERL